MAAGSNIDSVAVYGGTLTRPNAEFTALAIALGQALAKRQIKILYHAGRGELAKTCAETAAEAGGSILAVGTPLGELSVGYAQALHEASARMIEGAKCAIFLPGGIETISDLAEILSWRVLDYRTKPVAIMPVSFWTPLTDLFEHMIDKRVVRDSFLEDYVTGDSVEAILEALEREVRGQA